MPAEAYATVILVLTHVVLCAVRAATWVKKTFGLKPALERIRKERAQFRDGNPRTEQVDSMY